ncbi:pimeloyl-ACP methyl ester carboxylesterase [Yoonia maritima]|uniref:Pimeloyl-ACP methyl ester carboxylesterase n=1 Tax=Yoonia maritima TaxID=1435347 RepID=A0A2T0VU82_9RHOB|nr:alpha/beta hydrolase [Yoonia maritima]PRY75010.1 pimeloyl-ACP methyl ester carboxylesterase [Yoonia maritima]
MGRKTLKLATLALGFGAVLTGCGAQNRATKAEQSYPPLGDFVSVEGRRVHYVQSGQGPHLILLHGAGGNLRDFTFSLMDQLTDRYTVTAFDRPGLGYTDQVPGISTAPTATTGDSPQDQARMLRIASEMLGIEHPIVAGHSYGGIVTYAWAVEGLDTPSTVNARGIVSMAGVTMPWPGKLDPYYTINGSAFGGAITVPMISALVPRGVVNNRIEATFAPQTAPVGYADYIGAGLTLRPDSFRANVRQVNTLRPHVVTLSQRYPELTLPIEIVHGTADTTVPLHIHAEEVIKIVPSANLTRLDGVGHMPQQTNPDAIIAAIDRAAARAGLH